MIKVFIDAGHGGSDSGAVARGYVEKVANRNVANLVKTKLEGKGFIVVSPFLGDTTISLDSISVASNKEFCDLLISIHHNAGGGIGYEVIHQANNTISARFALLLSEEFAKVQPKHSTGIYYKLNKNGTDYFSVLRKTKCPAVITEFSFIDNDYMPEQDVIEANAIVTAVEKFASLYSKVDVDKPQEPLDEAFLHACDILGDRGIMTNRDYWKWQKNYKHEYVMKLIRTVGEYLEKL